MKVFVAYRHTGVPANELDGMLTPLRDALIKAGHEVYCTFFKEHEFQSKEYNPRMIMEHAFEVIESQDALLVILASSEKSEGMLMEVGRFYGKKPIIVAKHADVTGTYVPSMATVDFEWHDFQELHQKSVETLTKVDN